MLAGLQVFEASTGLRPDDRVPIVQGDQDGWEGALVPRERQQLDDQITELGVPRGLLIALSQVRDGLAPVEQDGVKSPIRALLIWIAECFEEVSVARSDRHLCAPGSPTIYTLLPRHAPMLILISNDDGITAPGILALAEAATVLGEVWVCAPATEQSAKSHGLTMHDPLRIHQHGPRRYAITGTPADSVYMGLVHLLPRIPDIVISGINRGSNLGSDVHYSGTVAAAREATLKDVPALATSLYITDWRKQGPFHYDAAAQVTIQVARAMLADPLPRGTFLNLNVPDGPLDQLKGVRVGAIGERLYESRVVASRDPRGKAYYWIGGPSRGFGGGPDTDGKLLEAGYAAASPLTLDPTDHQALGQVGRWFSDKD